MAGYIRLNRCKEFDELEHDKNALYLLMIIAMRAKRTNDFSVHNLKAGEALLGDYKNYGMTQKEYREAKERLTKWNFAAFQGTNRGTIAILTDQPFFDINIEAGGDPDDMQGASEGRTKGERGATNKKDNNIINKKDNKDIPPTPKDDPWEILWQRWVSYRSEIKRPYKSKDSISTAKAALNSLAGGDYETAVRVVEQSISSGWQGLFELKLNHGKENANDRTKRLKDHILEITGLAGEKEGDGSGNG